ncbi:hypothetical protein V8C34DRAFT_279568 [Trichoderma compactum]
MALSEDPTLPRDGRPDEIGNASSSDDSIAPPLVPARSDPETLRYCSYSRTDLLPLYAMQPSIPHVRCEWDLICSLCPKTCGARARFRHDAPLTASCFPSASSASSCPCIPAGFSCCMMMTTSMVPQDRDVHDASSVINEVCASL